MPALLLTLIGGFTSSMAKLAAFTAFIIAVLFVVFISLWLFGGDMFYYIMGLFFDFINALLQKMDIDVQMFDFMAAFHAIPASVKNIAAYTGFSASMKIIMLAISIRVALNLIPFLRV